jgi:hypothetical protein
MKHARVLVTVSLPSNLAERVEKQKSAVQRDAYGLRTTSPGRTLS